MGGGTPHEDGIVIEATNGGKCDGKDLVCGQRFGSNLWEYPISQDDRVQGYVYIGNALVPETRQRQEQSKLHRGFDPDIQVL